MNFLESVIKANLEILDFLNNNFTGSMHKSLGRGAGGDLSSGIDIAAEKIFLDRLLKFGTVISEECGEVKNESSGFEIIIDPIDGSDNLLSHFPYYGTSVALRKDNKNIISVIVNLANGDIFVKDEERFQKAKLYDLKFENVVVNPYSKSGIFERAYASKNFISRLHNNRIKYRSPGAFALSLAYAHDVSFVLYEGSFRLYDVAAGLHMCEDLFMKKTENFIFVSKDKENFDKISRIVLGKPSFEG